MTHIKKHKLTRAYQNPYQKKIKRNFFAWICFCLGIYNDKKGIIEVPPDFEYPQKNEDLCDKSPQVTWINHSSFLVQIGEKNILTDPIFSHRCSPVKFAGPKRQHAPGVDIEKLPIINFVLISHNHYDHLDKKSVLRLHESHPEIMWMVPRGVKRWFNRHGITNVAEFNWWDHITLVDENIKITAVPTQHFSGRHAFDINKTLWLGYVVEFLNEKKTLYFAGDTGYNPVHFNEIGEKFEKMDLSLIPIGAYSPIEFMGPVHISPKEAVDIHREVNSQLSVGSHHLTFKLSKEDPKQPPFDLYCAMEEALLDHNTFKVLKPGQKINW